MAVLDVLESLVGGAGLAGIDMFTTHQANKESLKNTKELMRYQTSLANEQQVQSYSNMVRGMMGAGLSPAWSDANPSAAVTPSASFDAKKSDAAARVASAFQLAGLEEDVKNKKLVNERQRIDNELAHLDLKNRKTEYGEYPTSFLMGEDGSLIPATNEAIAEYKSLHNGMLPDLVKLPELSGKGRFKAQSDIDELNTQVIERQTRRARALADSDKADFDRHVVQLMKKYPRDEIAKSLAKMPQKEIKNLEADIKLKGLQSTYQNLVNERYKSTSVVELFKTFKNPDIPWYDKLLYGLVMIAQKFIDK